MTIPAVVFPIGDDRYAVAAHRVREVVRAPRTTRLPTVTTDLLGAFNLRGEVVPMFDLAALLGVGRLVEAPFGVVIDTPSGLAALAVSGLPTVILLGDPIGPAELPGALGSYRIDGGVAVLIDADALLLPAADPADALAAP